VASIQATQEAGVQAGEESPLSVKQVMLEPVVVASIEDANDQGSGTQVEVASAPVSGGGGLGDLAEIIEAYNLVTEKLQVSHERLQGEVVRLRRELASADAQIQRQKRLAALGEMAAGIAHEIRNPLGAIQLYAEMVQDDLKPLKQEQAAGNVTKIIEGVRGLNAIVGDVLSFAKQAQTRPNWLEIDALWSRVVDASRAEIDVAGVEVVVEIGSGAPESAWVDGGLLTQALVNLVRNAVDAMSGSNSNEKVGRVEASRRLTLSSQAQGDGVLLSVADTGGGIGDADIDRIFNPFFTTRSTGTGLGLAIVHRIVDAHGGTVTAMNTHGDGGACGGEGGAVFRVFLPNPENTGGAGASESLEQVCNDSQKERD